MDQLEYLGMSEVERRAYDARQSCINTNTERLSIQHLVAQSERDRAKMREYELTIQDYEEALKNIRDREEYSCECVGDPCSCDFRYMHYEAEEVLAKYEEKGEKK